ncbi:MAG: DUF742 domain-containing protein [Actinomycetota bacterium]
MTWMDDEGPPPTLRVRPYTMTRGRTDTDVELTIETMIRATPERATRPTTVAEAGAIVELCADPQSIAEISAHLVLPLQVVKVLVGDLVMSQAVSTHRGGFQADGRPDLALLERVLDGLQSL